MLRLRPCPACGEVGRFLRHCWYRKYHFRRQVNILRVRCAGCGRTHALMPSFSLPGTSMGCGEVEGYLEARAEGQSRAKAGRDLLGQGISPRTLKRIERMLEVTVERGKGLFTGICDPSLGGLEWIGEVCGHRGEGRLYAMNRFCLQRGVNCLCFCRASILLFGRTVRSGTSSHNHGSPAAGRAVIDSG